MVWHILLMRVDIIWKDRAAHQLLLEVIYYCYFTITVQDRSRKRHIRAKVCASVEYELSQHWWPVQSEPHLCCLDVSLFTMIYMLCTQAIFVWLYNFLSVIMTSEWQMMIFSLCVALAQNSLWTQDSLRSTVRARGGKGELDLKVAGCKPHI